MTAETRENPVKFSKLIYVICPRLSAGPGPHPGGEGQVSTDVSLCQYRECGRTTEDKQLLCGGVGCVDIFNKENYVFKDGIGR